MTLVTKTRTRVFGSVLALTLLVAACGNAGSSKSSDTTAPAGPSTTFKGTDYSTNQPVKAPGVSSTEIRVGSVVSITNPVGGDYGLLNDGIDAYFNVVNAEGGVWGRKLKLVSKRDDQLSQNTTQVEALLSQDNVYAAFIRSSCSPAHRSSPRPASPRTAGTSTRNGRARRTSSRTSRRSVSRVARRSAACSRTSSSRSARTRSR